MVNKDRQETRRHLLLMFGLMLLGLMSSTRVASAVLPATSTKVAEQTSLQHHCSARIESSGEEQVSEM